MKTLLILFLSCAACVASPFLEMAPSPYTAGQNIASFNLFFDGATTAVNTPMVVDATGLPNMKFDLGSLSPTKHTVTAQAVTTTGVLSALSAPPFAFDLTPPVVPSNLSVEPK